MNIRPKLLPRKGKNLRGEYQPGQFIEVPEITVDSWDLYLPTAVKAAICAKLLQSPENYSDIYLDFNIFHQVKIHTRFALHNKIAHQVCWLPIESATSRDWLNTFNYLETGVLRDRTGLPLGIVHIFPPEYYAFLDHSKVRIEYIGILAEHQGQGLGRFLIESVIQAINWRWPDALIVLDTSATDLNAKGQLAKDFHEKFGFIVRANEDYTKPDTRLWYKARHDMIDRVYKNNLKHFQL